MDSTHLQCETYKITGIQNMSVYEEQIYYHVKLCSVIMRQHSDDITTKDIRNSSTSVRNFLHEMKKMLIYKSVLLHPVLCYMKHTLMCLNILHYIFT